MLLEVGHALPESAILRGELGRDPNVGPVHVSEESLGHGDSLRWGELWSKDFHGEPHQNVGEDVRLLESHDEPLLVNVALPSDGADFSTFPDKPDYPETEIMRRRGASPRRRRGPWLSVDDGGTTDRSCCRPCDVGTADTPDRSTRSGS